MVVLNAEQKKLIADLVDEYYGRWRRGERPDIEEYLQKYPHIARPLRKALAQEREGLELFAPLTAYEEPGMDPETERLAWQRLQTRIYQHEAERVFSGQTTVAAFVREALKKNREAARRAVEGIRRWVEEALQAGPQPQFIAVPVAVSTQGAVHTKGAVLGERQQVRARGGKQVVEHAELRSDGTLHVQLRVDEPRPKTVEVCLTAGPTRVRLGQFPVQEDGRVDVMLDLSTNF